MEIENEVPDPPEENVIAERIEPIAVDIDEIPFDDSLRGEFDQGEGDLEIVCAGNERIVCHSCIVECQSKILRRSIVKTSHDGLHLQRAQLSCPKFSAIQMRKVLGIMYPSQQAVFNSLNDMIEMLIIGAFYDIPWIVNSVKKAMLVLLPRIRTQTQEQKQVQATRCRDILLVLQENVQFSDDNPNPSYKPFDTTLEKITEILVKKLVALANQGIVPEPLDPVTITNQVSTYLQHHGREIEPNESIMVFLAYCFDETFEGDPDQNKIFNEVVRRNSVLQQTLVNEIPGIYRNRSNVPSPPTDDAQRNPENPLPQRPRRRRVRIDMQPIDISDSDTDSGDDDQNNQPPRPGQPIRAMPNIFRYRPIINPPVMNQPIEPVNRRVVQIGPVGIRAPADVVDRDEERRRDFLNDMNRLDQQMARARRRMENIRNRREHPDLRDDFPRPATMFKMDPVSDKKDAMLEKHTTIVRNLEKMKDTRPPRLLKMEATNAIRNIRNYVLSMRDVPSEAYRKRVKSFLELQSRLHKLMDSLEFKELDNELPFSTDRSNSSDKKAQIESDRKLAWELMNKSFDEDPTPESKKKSRKSLGSAANEASNDVLEVPTDPRKKLRKRKLENKQEKNEKKVMKSLSKKSVKSEESSTETNSNSAAQNAETGQAIKTDKDDNQPTVINQSEEDAALANVDMEPGPSGLNSKSISKMFGNKKK